MQATELSWPTDWSALFDRQRPLILEIGFGNGQFLVDLAQRHSDANLLGFEISLPSIRRAEQKLKVAKLDHVQLIQGSAPSILWAACLPETFTDVYINFPDPWPKHTDRRVINGRFLHLLATRMVQNGRLHIATDHPDYALVVTECLEQTPYFTSQLATTFVTEDNQRLRTKYELKAIAEGRTCHYYKWQRNHTVAPNPFSIPEVHPMPHVVLKSPLPLTEIGPKFEPQQASHAETTVRLIELFQSPRHQALFIDSYISEGPVNQRVGVSVRARAEDKLVVGLHEIGFPRPTSGVHLAVHTVAQWLLSLHPKIKIVNSSLQFSEASLNLP